MKLTRIQIKNYRSIFAGEGSGDFDLELGDGMNVLVGPNNCGKSNVLRALSLALDPDFPYNRAHDRPAVQSVSMPVITLTFHSEGQGREDTLLRRLADYERKVKQDGRPIYADDGIIKLRVSIEGGESSKGIRRSVFGARGVGARSLASDDKTACRAYDQFRKCVRFVMIESGQSLESVLEGRFREILRTVVADHLKGQVAAAEGLRSTYINDLQSELLAPLTQRIADMSSQIFPEISGVVLDPAVRPLDETIAGMRLLLEDAALTELADKGTGMRGGVLTAMLSYLADNGKQSMIFAVEEPEAFLHPSAQECQREDLEALAERNDVSLLVTTHSPFLVSRHQEARIYALAKDGEGRTSVESTAQGSEPQATLLGGLFRDRIYAHLLEQAAAFPEKTAGVVIVEGGTDASYFNTAVRVADREDLLVGIHVVAAEGANDAVLRAIILRETSGVPVVVLLDNDVHGKEAKKKLTKNFNFKNRLEVVRYNQFFEHEDFAYEAEDLWPDQLIGGFVSGRGEQVLKDSTVRPDGQAHYDIRFEFKGELARYVDEQAKPAHCGRWIDLLEHLRSETNLPPTTGEGP
ncbi:ATP-dependent nuclease [Candidatus Poriferisocius sp.]|uniref:ATP-dependent nuclease n=1 Tax=Candidatus Poriferisocius sp. TaxID=3101276 RepID=UPI003B022AAF